MFVKIIVRVMKFKNIIKLYLVMKDLMLLCWVCCGRWCGGCFSKFLIFKKEKSVFVWILFLVVCGGVVGDIVWGVMWFILVVFFID